MEVRTKIINAKATHFLNIFITQDKEKMIQQEIKKEIDWLLLPT